MIASTQGSVWDRLRTYFRPGPIATVVLLGMFLRERAALIAQKCAIDYVRGKTGLASYALFTEATFLKALDICRLESFAAVLGDLLILVEGHLRPHVLGSRQARLCEALRAIYGAELAALPPAEHRPEGWGDSLESFAGRLQAASAGEPRQALDVADHSAKRMFDTLPIHISMRELDEEPIYGAVRFRMIAVNQEMQRRLAAAPLARQLAS